MSSTPSKLSRAPKGPLLLALADGTWLGSPFWMALLLLGLPPDGRRMER